MIRGTEGACTPWTTVQQLHSMCGGIEPTELVGQLFSRDNVTGIWVKINYNPPKRLAFDQLLCVVGPLVPLFDPASQWHNRFEICQMVAQAN